MAEMQAPQAISIDRWFTGLYTHRSPLMTPFTFVGISMIERKDALLDGLNGELTDLFTIRRRFGFSSFAATSGGTLRNLYSFKDLTGTLHLIGDMTSTISFVATDATLFSPGYTSPKRVSFQSVANTLYWSDTVIPKKWIIASAWKASTNYNTDDLIVDVNGVLFQVTTPGISGASTPGFTSAEGAGDQVTDGSVVWTCRGFQQQNFGVDPPTNAPTISFGPYPTSYPSWAASTQYNAVLVVDDSNNNVQELTTPGKTGASAPTWNVTPGGTTADGTAVWTNKGTANWQANHAYSVGDIVVGTYSYQVTVMTSRGTYPDYQPTFETITETGTNAFKCTAAGTSGASEPSWVPGSGSNIQDNTVSWVSLGSVPNWTANQNVSNAATIVDSNGYLQNLLQAGISGASEPTWGTNLNDLTNDGSAVWQNAGPYSAAGTADEFYSYAYKASATGHISSRSPRSVAIRNVKNSMNIVQGVGCPDRFYDTVQIYRTKQGGDVDFLLKEIPRTDLWTFNDTTPDNLLDTDVIAAVGTNDAPPVGITNLCFYAGRMWGSVDNTVFFATGPDATLGVPEEAWNVLNYFQFPGTVIALYPIQGGLLVFLNDDLYEILGTSADQFFAQLSQSKLGVANPDAIAFDGTNLYIYTSLSQLQLVTSSGNSEVGFDVADVLKQYFPPATTSLTVLRDGTNESALYVSSGTGYMLRYSLTTKTWSPLWQVSIGKAWAVEVSPQEYKLLGQMGANIAQRDTTLYTDLGTAYSWFFTLGTLNTAPAGALTEIDFIAIQSRAGGSKPTVSYLPNDISGTFATLGDPQNEPPELPQGSGMTGYRWYLLSNSIAAPTVMQRIQVKVSFPAENFSNEIFELTIKPKETVAA